MSERAKDRTVIWQALMEMIKAGQISARSAEEAVDDLKAAHRALFDED